MYRDAYWRCIWLAARVVLTCAIPFVLLTCSPQEGFFRLTGGGGTGGNGLSSTADGFTASGGLQGSGGQRTGGRTGAAGSFSGGAGGGGSGAEAVGTGGNQTPGSGGMVPGGTTAEGGTNNAGTGGMANGGMAGAGTAGTGTAGAGPLAVSVDFVGGIPNAQGALVPAMAMAASETAGLNPTAQWNSASGPAGSILALRSSDGAATSARITWSAPPTVGNPGVWRNPYIDAPGDTRMMNGYIDPSAVGSPATITVSGLPATLSTVGYDVYVYAAGDVPGGQTRTYSYTIGAMTIRVTQTGPSPSPSTFPGYTVVPAGGGTGNTIVFPGLRVASFTLMAVVTGPGQRAPVNGIQIISRMAQ